MREKNWTSIRLCLKSELSHRCYFRLVKFIVGYVYVGLCALRNWRNVDSQSSLGHFSFVIHQQLFGKVLGAKITFFIFNNAIKLLNYLVLCFIAHCCQPLLFTPTKDKDFMDCWTKKKSLSFRNLARILCPFLRIFFEFHWNLLYNDLFYSSLFGTDQSRTLQELPIEQLHDDDFFKLFIEAKALGIIRIFEWHFVGKLLFFSY